MQPTSPFRLGRTPHPQQVRMRCPAEAFIDFAKLPDPPAEFDYTAAATKSIKHMYANDRLGDCVIALFYHFLGVETAGAGNEVIVSDADVIKDYSAVGGYVPGRPSTDRGCNEQDAMHYYQTKGFVNGDKIEGWLTVNPKDIEACKKLCWLFEGLYYGYGIPNAWLNTRDGDNWDDLRGNPNNGHAFGSFGWKNGRWTISTWGGLRYMSDAAHRRMSECYVILNDSMVNKASQTAPNAIDWAGLVTYWNSAGGDLPEPPAPMPTPWMDLR